MTSQKSADMPEMHARSSFLSNFILGSQDGLVNVLGILLGLTAATSDIRIIFVAAFAALGAESISMGAVAYTSTLARRKQYLKEVSREETEMREMPEKEKSEVRYVFQKWGYQGEELERLTEMIASRPKAWLEFMMSHELQLEPVGEQEPRRSFIVVLSSTVFGSFIPLIPYFLVGKDVFLGAAGSVAVSGAVLFIVGYYEARTTVGSLWKSGLQMAAIGLAAGLAGFLIGHFIGAAPT
ncbi:MAG: VIT1/CCC1 transporter family protein [Thaumarchaeota archaeon]|nr:VIT1/CCC1 transporter family protein [Nitrososphaerota archaeon]